MSNFSLDTAKRLFSSEEQFPVNFDEAWQWLEYSKKSNAKRIFSSCDFIKGQDYEVILRNEQNSIQQGFDDNLGGRPSEEISLTIECFKMWAMMSKTETGRKVREYFLECERIAKAKSQPALKFPENYIDALKELGRVCIESAETQEKLLEAKAQLEEQAPLVDFAQDIMGSEDSITVSDFARNLEVGRTTFFRHLREMGIIMQSSALPYQRFMDKKYFEVTQKVTSTAKGDRIDCVALVTAKGQPWLHKTYQKYLDKKAMENRMELLTF